MTTNSMMNSTFPSLFPYFPREIGVDGLRPFRFYVNLRQFKSNFAKYGCTNNFYVNISSAENVISSIFYDFDMAGNRLEYALDEAKTLFKYCSEKYGITPVSVASGFKGFHIYVPIKHFKVYGREQKIYYKNASNYLISCAFDETPVTLDFHVVGDVNRLTRVPNTINTKSKQWCVVLPQDTFLELTVDDVKQYVKKPNAIRAEVIRKVSLSELVDPEQTTDNSQQQDIKISQHISSSTLIPPHKELFEPLLRPIVYRYLTNTNNPKHIIRLTATVELLRKGVHPKSIFDFYQSLNWRDWNASITKKQIEYMLQSLSHYKPCSVRKLKLILGES